MYPFYPPTNNQWSKQHLGPRKVWEDKNQMYIYAQKDMNILPQQIIPQKSAADLLNSMASKASKRYDENSRRNIPIAHKSFSNTNNKIIRSKDKSEVLFLPDKRNIECNENKASAGKVKI